ncbi:MAG: hypothetical protein U0930_17870 [Pirellulales bacterium]
MTIASANLSPDFEISLIEPIDDLPPKMSIKQATATDDRIELPIAQPNTRQIISGTLILAVVASLFSVAVPNGILKPDHWLRYDRKLVELSIRGGYSILKRDDIICLISISDQRKETAVRASSDFERDQQTRQALLS